MRTADQGVGGARGLETGAFRDRLEEAAQENGAGHPDDIRRDPKSQRSNGTGTAACVRTRQERKGAEPSLASLGDLS